MFQALISLRTLNVWLIFSFNFNAIYLKQDWMKNLDPSNLIVTFSGQNSSWPCFNKFWNLDFA